MLALIETEAIEGISGPFESEDITADEPLPSTSAGSVVRPMQLTGTLDEHAPQPNEPQSTSGVTCPNYFDQVGENCYYFSQDYGDSRSWDSARTYCQSLESDLAVFGIDCADTDRLIKHIIREDYATMWVGASDEAQENFWVWIDGRPVDMKSKLWFYNEPDSGSTNDCALLTLNYSVHRRLTLLVHLSRLLAA
ncbi:hypothetical protein Pcinc_006283 [Petrolisthes cinctipes]|uniref:C-type lectin domain-containing protein n=1 Tax=Petrolisthes cinctipes TaxID=88211 RepID=A0AAE1KZP9_PETCI|nr:hypothetical protein Pcinc_006283 [Petrolisthes cinctipes]